MKFFLPGATGDQGLAERSYEAIKRKVLFFDGPTDGKRYYEIFYRHNGKDLRARVGDNDPLERELVVAIFKAKHTAGPFMVCTPNRGVVRGGPIFASGDAKAVEFDPGEVPRH